MPGHLTDTDKEALIKYYTDVIPSAEDRTVNDPIFILTEAEIILIRNAAFSKDKLQPKYLSEEDKDAFTKIMKQEYHWKDVQFHGKFCILIADVVVSYPLDSNKIEY